jgi:hypothetical protein
MRRPPDPLTLPGAEESLEVTLARTVPLAGTPGQAYVERRYIRLEVATAAGVRYAANFAGRPAVLVGLYDDCARLVSVHGRYLSVVRAQDKMLTIGPGGGTINVLGGWRVDLLILVEGLFDALSLSNCGYDCAAMIGRHVPWLTSVAAGRTVWLAFDAGRPGEVEAARYVSQLGGSDSRRMPPPGRSKDWNTALMKSDRATVSDWVRVCLAKKVEIR